MVECEMVSLIPLVYMVLVILKHVYDVYMAYGLIVNILYRKIKINKST